MTNLIIKFDATDINTVESLNEHINAKLAAYPATKDVVLTWQLPKENEKGLAELMTLTQLVKRSQDARGLGTDSDAKKARKAEFDGVKAVFVLEHINDKIEALLRFLGYQPRFTGVSKSGIGGMQFIPPTKASNDGVGKAVKAMGADKRAVQAQEELAAIYGKKNVARFVAGEITAQELRDTVREVAALIVNE